MSVKPNAEMLELLSWIGHPPRSPMQTHGLNESDCEVLDLGNGTFLAATVDTVSEEIEVGLYRDPYRIGWVAAMASLSDLAAVGARPLGMLLSAEWGAKQDLAAKAEIARGFSDALKRCQTYWLGGDTGRARSTVLGGVGLGLCDSRPLSRVGAKPGHLVCVTGQLGAGPALAIRFLVGGAPESFPESHYLPVARLDAGIALRGLASAAMDSSDGLLQTLHTICSLNGSGSGAGMELFWSDELISEPARQYCQAQGYPQWTLWEAEHGDYQLVLTIPKQNLAESMSLVTDLQVIGEVSSTPGIRVKLLDQRIENIDPDLARSLLNASHGDVSEALLKLMDLMRKRNFP